MEKIYGVYPGNQNPEIVKNMSEVELFFCIENLETNIWFSTEYTYALLSPEEIDEYLSESYYGLDYLLYQTTRFGVKFPNPTFGVRVEKNKYYNAWYKFYKNYYFSVLTDSEYTSATLYGPDSSISLPTGCWKSLLANSKEEKPKQY